MADWGRAGGSALHFLTEIKMQNQPSGEAVQVLLLQTGKKKKKDTWKEF